MPKAGKFSGNASDIVEVSSNDLDQSTANKGASNIT